MSTQTFNLVSPPVNAYSPGIIAQWAQTDLKISDQGTYARIAQFYTDWYQSRTHEVSINENAQGVDPDTCLHFDVSYFPKQKEFIIAAANTRQPHVMWVVNKIQRNDVTKDTSRTLATYAMRSFSDPAYQGVYGHGLQSHETLPESWNDRFSLVYERAIGNARNSFIAGVGVLLDKVDIAAWQNIQTHIIEVETQKLDAAKSAFLKRLDQGALQIMQETGYATDQIYAWLSGRHARAHHWNTACTKRHMDSPLINRDQRNRRHEIALKIPSMLSLLSGNTREGRKLTEALDAGMPIFDTLKQVQSQQIAQPVANGLTASNVYKFPGLK